jgi:ABC-type uncharacterized transport system substrate-binding protein
MAAITGRHWRWRQATLCHAFVCGFTFLPYWPIMGTHCFAGRTPRILKRIILSLATTLALTMLALTTGAAAHPHLFATMETALLTTAEGKISGLRIRWNFDETYTQYSLEGLDTNQNGTYEPDEIKPLTEENIKSLVESDYFTAARQAGAEVALGAVTVYGQDMVDQKLSLWFELPFATPVDPKAGPFEARIYDPDFFIAFDYIPEKPPQLVGQLAPGCSMDLKPLPTTEEMDRTREMLSDKPQDWTPDQPTDFGSLFAQPLVVTCAS